MKKRCLFSLLAAVETYARNGKLPDWFEEIVSATSPTVPEEKMSDKSLSDTAKREKTDATVWRQAQHAFLSARFNLELLPGLCIKRCRAMPASRNGESRST